jgi:phosphopantothenate synthetase
MLVKAVKNMVSQESVVRIFQKEKKESIISNFCNAERFAAANFPT